MLDSAPTKGQVSSLFRGLVLALCCLSCGGDGPPPDGTLSDAPSADASPPDASPADAASVEAALADATSDTAPDADASIPTLAIVAGGQALAQVVVGQDATAQVKAAAQTLVDYVEQATGVELPLITETALGSTQGIAIHVGKTALSGQPGWLPAQLDRDGFVIEVDEQQRSIVIRGPGDWGTEFGVYELLERHVGVRWLLPGPDGTHVPALERIEIPEGRRVEQPVFFSRKLSGLKSAAELTWARFNRMHGRISFHHNLIKLFPPESYTQSHPHFFPMKDGQTRYLPPNNRTHGWQPCFSAAGIVEEAAKNIIAYFDANPGATSYSLGANDNSGHCRCPTCLAKVPQQKNFLGRDDYSDLYYGWAYQVIEKVLAVHPDKRFGALAYSEVAAPPKNVAVHPRMVPFMTYDRMKWIDPAVKLAGHDATRSWQQKAPALGWYDYLYGTPYCLPRVHFGQAAEVLRYGQQHGVVAQYAELYPNWGEGPKPYIFLRLRWNPQLDPDRLLKDWCEHAVGEDAAPYLEQYYRIWERFWTSDILTSSWFTRSGQYLRFNNPSYLADVKDHDIEQSRLLLETCVARAKTAEQKRRAELLEQAFQYYEASALAYLGDHRRLAGSTEQEVLASLAVAEEAMCMAEKRRELALAVFPQDPLLKHPIAIDGSWSAMLGGKSWGQTGLWLALERAAQGNTVVRQQLQQLAAASACDNVRSTADLVLDVALSRSSPVRNPSFESGSGVAASDWSLWNKVDPATGKRAGTIGRSQARSRRGGHSILCDGIYRGGPYQTIQGVTPGRYLLAAWAHVSAHRPSAKLQLSLVPRDSSGKDLPSVSRTLRPEAGSWVFVSLQADLPAQTASARIVPIAHGYQAGAKVYWDDVALYRIDPSAQ
jgi:hypothetical protein